jgi:hypothetical protein
MTVLSVPGRLRVATLVLLLSIPLAALQTVIATRAPWWRLPYKSMGVWAIAVAMICIPLGGWLAYGKRWAYGLTAMFAFFWLVLSAWIALRLRYPTLGFFALFLLVYFGVLLLWLRSEIGRSFFDPQLPWYQGAPKPMPGLRCQLLLSEKRTIDVKVGRLDAEGVFIFADTGVPALRARQKVEIEFTLRDRTVRCHGYPMRALIGGLGFGLQFRKLSPDLRKELGDFVESLKGEGYVG